MLSFFANYFDAKQDGVNRKCNNSYKSANPKELIENNVSQVYTCRNC